MSLPESSFHLATRLWIEEMGVRVSKPSWSSQLRRARLSTMDTSYPRAERCSAEAQPQYPSPPITMTFLPLPSSVSCTSVPAGVAVAACNVAGSFVGWVGEESGRDEAREGRGGGRCQPRASAGTRGAQSKERGDSRGESWGASSRSAQCRSG